MYLIKNISGALSVAGLCPGETKEIEDKSLTDDLIKLSNKGLILISHIATKKKENKIVKDEVKE